MRCFLSIILFLANIYPGFVRQDGVVYYWNDIPPAVSATDYASCGLICVKTTGCNAFTYDNTRKLCIPKTRVGDLIVQMTDAISGYNRE